MKTMKILKATLVRLFGITLCLGSMISGVFAANEESSNTDTIVLEGSNWQLVRMTVLGGYEFTPEDPGKYVLNFRGDDRLTGSSDCNELGGLWFQEGTSLHFEPFYTSRRLCAPGSLHNNFALYLRGTDRFEMVADHIILRTATDGVELEFEAR